VRGGVFLQHDRPAKGGPSSEEIARGS